MPLLKTSGNNTADGYGGGVAAIPNYIEDVFSTYLYTGNDTSQTITNNIDLSTKGGMVWIKSRSGTYSTGYNVVNDTVRGAQKDLYTNTTGSQSTNAQGLTAFTSSGFSVGSSTDVNGGSTNIVSWTFRKQPKFFDVVTYTGNGTAGRTVAHSLGSVPGCVIIKCTSTTGNWVVRHIGVGGSDMTVYGSGDQLYLNSTAAASGTTDIKANSTVITLGSTTDKNVNGATYVAYLFAHNAGGFGLTGTDNVISCGSFSGSGTQTINLGWEPQWVMVKRTDSTGGPWYIADNMRGLPASTSATVNYLKAESSGAEVTYTNDLLINSTGFTTPGFSGQTCIYIAIRRGPMKVPTDATKVFTPALYNSGNFVTTGFPVDSQLQPTRNGTANFPVWFDRLRGISSTGTAASPSLTTSSTAAETTSVANTTGWTSAGYYPANGANAVSYNFGRAPSFFDEVCYTGTGANQNVTHNLGVAPELIILKSRSATTGWYVYSSALGATFHLILNTTAAKSGPSSVWNSTAPTASVFTLGATIGANDTGATYVAYLFATCVGVSKVGSYTGNGSTQTINCGFAGGARFVLIKRTDSTGDWYVYDTARGMTTLTDPYLLLNSTAAESATLGSVTTVTTGFAVNASILAAINTNGASYIFLAIA